MYRISRKRLAKLLESGKQGLLRSSRKGLEKESLRVTPDGTIAQTRHPESLGSALTHPWITTDYSEALLEFITPPHFETSETLDFLEDIHRFVYHRLGDELLWVTSMPCIVGGDASIPIARYGDSNVGMMKHVYRRGLDWRYGRTMQAISGIHFNYSFGDDFLQELQRQQNDNRDAQTFRSDVYFGLIRNFQRFGWLIPLLFGASPAICRSFAGDEELGFETFDESTLYEPYGTSLRMSDIGYKNKAQAGLNISYNDLDAYVASLTHAISTPDEEYQRIGVRVDGTYRQLNANILQIENEYYSFVRPKAVAESGERPTTALKRAGVEYVEIRALDLNPFEPLGVNADTLLFLEILLVFCLLEDSPPIAPRELRGINHNQGQVARHGRAPDLQLYRNGGKVPLRTWAMEIMDALGGIATLLDQNREGTPYTDVLAACRSCITDPSQTPSARVLADMSKREESFIKFAMRMSRAHEKHFRTNGLAPEVEARFTQAALESLDWQREIEASDSEAFEDYLARYMAQGTA
ncbi:MAG: glutamate--cysteine ligase [Aquisalimonadaceae bacterium]